jgi:restriction endonuclease S subunit
MERTPKTIFPIARLDKLLIDSFSGGTPAKSVPEYWDGDIPWASPKDFIQFRIGDTEDCISKSGLRASKLKIAPEGTVLVVFRSGILRHTLPVGLTTRPVAVNQDVKALIPDPKRLLPEFLANYLVVVGEKLLPLITKHSTTVQSINTTQFSALMLPCPPLNIQKQMSAEMQAARTARQEKLAAADALLAGLDGFLLEQLGLTLPQEETRLAYGVTLKDVDADRFDPHFHNPRFHSLVESIQSRPYDKLGNIVQFSNQQWNPKESDSEYFTYIEISGIALSSGMVTPSEVLVSEAPSRARMLVRTGDIIISLTRPHRGAIALIGSDLDGCVASTGFAVIRRIIRDDITRDYLWCVLRSQLCLQQMLQRSSGGNYPAITQPELTKISIPTPSISVQREIVAKVRNCHEEARSLRTEAAQEWEAAKARFEARLLGKDR